MKMLFTIGVGSFVGGILRYLLSQFIQGRIVLAFPFGTFSVNIIGCFLIGIVYGLTESGNLSVEWRLFLATGILGGFTTFSAFSYETVSLIRDGQVGYAVGYICLSVLIGLIATFVGISIIKFL